MAQSQTKAIDQEQFLLIAVNLLHRAFLDCSRADAKQRFRQLEEGSTLGLPTVELEDKTRARFAVGLDSSEFRGRLNFSAFRTSLESLIGNMAQQMQKEHQVSTYAAQDGRNSTIFGVTGPSMSRGVANVIVLAAEPVQDGDLMVLRLMYIDPTQFAELPA